LTFEIILMKPQSLSKKQVQHIGKLANLHLSKKEIKKFQKQLSETLDYIKILDELDTSKVEPTSQVTGKFNQFREDKVEKSFTQKQALSNAKRTYRGYFVVDYVFK